MPVAQPFRAHGVADASFYGWRAKQGGIDVSMVGQIRAEEEENRRLACMGADLNMHTELLNCDGERH